MGSAEETPIPALREGVELELGLEYVQKSDEKIDFVIVKLAEGRDQKRTHVIRLKLKEYNPAAPNFNPNSMAFVATEDDDSRTTGTEEPPLPRNSSGKKKKKKKKVK